MKSELKDLKEAGNMMHKLITHFNYLITTQKTKSQFEYATLSGLKND